MVAPKSFSTLKILLFIPFIIAAFFAFFQVKKYRLQSKRQAINQLTGKQFPQLPLLDVTGKNVALDLNKNGITIIDFWYKNCPACIREMQQFENVLKGKEETIAIVSISIDPNEIWQKTLSGNFPPLSFLEKSVENWRHLLVDFSRRRTDKNNAEQLSEILNVTSFPSYFVLDKQGIIIATPPSAVTYIKTSVSNQNELVVFLTSMATWKSIQTISLLLISVIVYNFLFNFFATQINKRKAV